MATKKLGEVSLLIDGHVFKANKDLLCEHSDYFRAMFSGNYVEEDKKEIFIDVVDANSMNIILKYMKLGFIILSEYSLPTIGELAISANFLQITELIKQIEYCLELKLSILTWVEIMTIAENASYHKLEERAAAYGLYEFKYMIPEFIQPVYKFVWYLSHKYLNVESELQVFRFGCDWVNLKELGADMLLLVLGCVDITRLSKEDILRIIDLVKEHENSLIEKVVYCLLKLVTDLQISEKELVANKTSICEDYTERVYTEVLNLIVNNRKRELEFKACVGLWSKEHEPNVESPVASNYLYMFHEDRFVKWLEIAEKDLWGWNAVTWGPTKIIIVCGEHGRGTGFFWRGVKVYDVIRKEWTEHGTNLPVRRHGGVAMIGDSLYVIGGVGGYRVLLDTAIVYHMKERNWRQIAKFPEAIQSPAICIHDKVVYAAGQKTIYRYEENADRWVTVIGTDIRPSCMISFQGYIYCTQNYFNNLYRFKPGVDDKLELTMYFSSSPSALCNLGNKLLIFTSANGTQADKVTVEEITDAATQKEPNIVWSRQNCAYTINDVAGCCAIVHGMPPIANELTPYLKRCVANYEACQPV